MSADRTRVPSSCARPRSDASRLAAFSIRTRIAKTQTAALGRAWVYAADRTWRCSVRILRNYGYDPAIFGDRVTGRVLCIHIANRGRFVRWKFDGGGD